MKINYKEIMRDAKKRNVSPYIIIKEKLNYRDKEESYIARCYSCKSMVSVSYKNRKMDQCRTIGIINDLDANIDFDSVCDKYDYRGYND